LQLQEPRVCARSILVPPRRHTNHSVSGGVVQNAGVEVLKLFRVNSGTVITSMDETGIAHRFCIILPQDHTRPRDFASRIDPKDFIHLI